LGLFEVFSGLLTCWVTVANAATGIGHLQDMGASGVQPPAEWIAYVFAIILGFGVASLAGVAIGIWNLASVRRTARSPLIAAVVVSAASIVLMMVFFSGSPFEPVKIGWVLLHAVVSIWTIGILRLKKVPAP
jgi:Na+-driven multidrug efflux pump